MPTPDQAFWQPGRSPLARLTAHFWRVAMAPSRSGHRQARPPGRTLAVLKFLNGWPGQGCPPSPEEPRFPEEGIRVWDAGCTRRACARERMAFDQRRVEALG
jgi:hypothetical protein